MDVVYIGGGQYKHEGDVLRAIPYAAFNGQEGVIGPGDLKVVEGATPGGFVNVNPGVATALGRGPAQSYEMYVAKSEVAESVAIQATDSSGSRSDLVIVRVVDPEDGPAGDTVPADPVVGPYAFPEVLFDVDASTTSLEDTFATHGVRSGYALARVDLPVSTGTVTNSEIVPLRSLANARKDFYQNYQRHSSTTLTTPFTTSRVFFPQESENNLYTPMVPPWATMMNVRYDITTAAAVDAASPANVYGNHELYINGSNVVGFTEWNFDWNGGAARFTMTAFADVDVTSYQGQSVEVSSKVYFQGGAGELQEDNGTNTFLQAFFTEETL